MDNKFQPLRQINRANKDTIDTVIGEAFLNDYWSNDKVENKLNNQPYIKQHDDIAEPSMAQQAFGMRRVYDKTGRTL